MSEIMARRIVFYCATVWSTSLTAAALMAASSLWMSEISGQTHRLLFDLVDNFVDHRCCSVLLDSRDCDHFALRRSGEVLAQPILAEASVFIPKASPKNASHPSLLAGGAQ